MEVFPLAFDILDARWSGKPEVENVAQVDLDRAAATGDIAAAINETLKDAGI
jgi:hypothetical protein